ncbi:MAG: zinc-dependent alcohol dehydrogenase [Christensenellales bacterium]
MLQYYFKKPGVIQQRQAEKPLCGDDEVLIRVAQIGLCGSDLHLYSGTYSGPLQYPVMFGHEWSGVVEEVGSRVGGFAAGDWVTGDCSCYCGHCDVCQTNKNLCDKIEKFGITIDGASAQYIVRNQRYVYKAPQGLPRDLICLTEPVAVAAQMLHQLAAMEDLKKKKILVYGGGTIGMAVLMLLVYHYQCGDVSLYDLVDNRNALAKELGATIPREQDLSYAPKSGSYGDIYAAGRYDIIIETTGSPIVLAHSFNIIKTRGIIGCLGMMDEAVIPQKMIVTKGLRVVGSIGGTGQFPMVMEFMTEQADVARRLISGRFSAEEMEQAFVAAKDIERSLKVVIDFSEELTKV